MKILGSAWRGDMGWMSGEWEILIDTWIGDLELGDNGGGWIGVREDGEWGWIIPESIVEWIDRGNRKKLWKGVSWGFNNNIERGIQREKVVWEPLYKTSWGWVYDGGYAKWEDILGIVPSGEILVGEGEERVIRDYDLSGVVIRNRGWLRIENCIGNGVELECSGDWSLVVVGSEFRDLEIRCSGVCHRFWWWGGEIINSRGFDWSAEILGEAVWERCVLVGEEFSRKRLEGGGFKMINILNEN